jgi:hypothetical protein
MAAASRDRKGHKRSQPRGAQAKIQGAPKRKSRTVKSTLLNAQRDATLKQKVLRKHRENSEQVHGSKSSELIELVNRRTSAFLELPMRMARCRSPFALWSEQTQFMYGMFSDCQLLAQCMMTNAAR